MRLALDGVEVCRHIRNFSDAYVVMLTARTEEIDVLIGLAVGLDDSTTKPFSPPGLSTRIRACFGGHRRRPWGGSRKRPTCARSGLSPLSARAGGQQAAPRAHRQRRRLSDGRRPRRPTAAIANSGGLPPGCSLPTVRSCSPVRAASTYEWSSRRFFRKSSRTISAKSGVSHTPAETARVEKAVRSAMVLAPIVAPLVSFSIAMGVTWLLMRRSPGSRASSR